MSTVIPPQWWPLISSTAHQLHRLRSKGCFNPNRITKRQYSAPMSGEIPYSKQKYVPSSGTYPRGFSASGTFAGVKPSNTGTPDVALIVSDTPCTAAAVFTMNKFKAAPVQVSKQTLKLTGGESIRAVVVNSGCANAVTGQQGLADAKMMREAVDNFCFKEEKVSRVVRPDEPNAGKTLVMSTGVIGQP